jgi:putative transposase
MTQAESIAISRESEAPDIPQELIDLVASKVKTQADLSGPGSIMQQLFKAIVEKSMNAELDHHLGYDKHAAEGRGSGNSRNGKGRKKVITDHGPLPIETPRDRNGTFEPQLVPKRERRFKAFDHIILALYARGMTTRDIESTVRELYGVELSPTLISQVTEALEEEVRNWQNSPLDAVYPLIWLDGLTIKVHQDRQVVQKTVHLALGLTLEGRKELLGIWIAENEGAKYWAQVLVELQSRGVKDVLIFCVDGLTGFPAAIESVFPRSEVQLCIVHMVRASLRYVADKDKKAVAKSLKTIYSTAGIETAEASLEAFEKEWGARYLSVVRLWRRKWENVVPLFAYPPEIRKVMYTTNAIESVNMTIRKAIRNRRIFPSDVSAVKLVYLAVRQAAENWTRPVQDWNKAYNFLLVKFGSRLEKE